MRREPAFLDNCFSQFPRTQRLDAWSANPIEAPNPPLWLRVLAITVLSGCDASAEPIAVRSAREDAGARSSRDWVAAVVCRGHPFTWESDKVLVCHQEKAP